MNEHFSPNLFLFQSYVLEVLKESKKIIKTGIFENLDPQNLLETHKNQHIDLFHQYFLQAMGNHKLRELACNNYEKLLRQSLVEKEHLPANMVSTIISSCSSSGGSTTGSSIGSTTLTNSSLQTNSVYVGNLIKSILIETYQPTSELIVGLNYLLEGTRKKYANFYLSTLQQLYTSFLCKFRISSLERFMKCYINNLIDEVQYHIDDEAYVFASRQMNSLTNKVEMPVFEEREGYGKFGKCYICSKQANHYIKEEHTPICSISCRDAYRQLVVSCKNPQPFHLLQWLLDHLSFGDQIIFSMLCREIAYYVGRNALTFNTIHNILKISIHHLRNFKNGGRYVLKMFEIICTKIDSLLTISDQIDHNYDSLEIILKVYYLELIHFLEESPMTKQNCEYVITMVDLLKCQEIFHKIFILYDCKFFQISILSRMLNIISQYAKIYGHVIQGIASILQMLVHLYITCENNLSLNHKKESLKQLYQKFNAEEYLKKKQLKKVITLFNKKPKHGIKHLKKIFEEVEAMGMEISMEISKISEEVLQESKISESPLEEIEKHQSKESIEDQPKSIDSSPIHAEPDTKETNSEIQVQSTKYNQELANQQQTKSQPKQIQKQTESLSKIQEKQQQVSKINSKQKMEQNEMKNKAEVNKKPQIKSKISSRQIAIFIRQNLEVNHFMSLETKLIQPLALDKTKVGEYFGTDDKEANGICRQFIRLIDFQGLQLDDILRIVLNLFSLPKEAQQLERILGELSAELVDVIHLKNDNGTYFYIYLLMMVQTSHQNPNVKETEKLSLQKYLELCQHVEGGISKEQATHDFNRILETPLNIKMKYPDDTIFKRKYLMNVASEGSQPPKANRMTEQDEYVEEIEEKKGLFAQLPYSNMDEMHLSGQLCIGSLPRNLLLHIWQYLLISLISQSNSEGVYECVLLYGKYKLVEEQKIFFECLRKMVEHGNKLYYKDCLLSLMKVAIEFPNYLFNPCWEYIIKIVYTLESHEAEHQHILQQNPSNLIDKLFTNSQFMTPSTLTSFIQSLLIFSASQFKIDIQYTRELFVLRHITEVLEYNLHRFDVIWQNVWTQIAEYFKEICLHGKKHIAMAAIDSYKQLTLKIIAISKPQKSPLPHATTQMMENQQETIVEEQHMERQEMIKRQEKKEDEAVVIPHSSILQPYLYIFQRSSQQLRDLIINILLNIITSQLNSGYDTIYQILDIQDYEDKHTIYKIIDRLIKEITLPRLTDVAKLHQLCLKELKVCQKESIVELFLHKIWEISQYINSTSTWLQTLRSIKDIYKYSHNFNLLTLFYKICNRCIAEQRFHSQQNLNVATHTRKSSIEYISIVHNRDSNIKFEYKDHQNIHKESSNKEQANKESSNNEQSNKESSKVPQSKQQILSINRELYVEVVDLLIYLLDINKNKKINECMHVILKSFDEFQALDTEYFMKYSIGSSGFLSIFDIYLTSPYTILFAMFFKNYFNTHLVPKLHCQHLQKQRSFLFEWVIAKYNQYLPQDLINLKDCDPDFKKQIAHLLPKYQSFQHSFNPLQTNSQFKHKNISSQNKDEISSGLVEESQDLNRNELIEFHLSNREFSEKCVLHLIFLDVLSEIYKSIKMELQRMEQKEVIQLQSFFAYDKKMTYKIEQCLIQSYQKAVEVNKLVVFRQFLQNNNFLIFSWMDELQLHDNKHSQIKMLPGLHRQEHRTLKFILIHTNKQLMYQYFIKIIKQYSFNYILKYQLQTLYHKISQNILEIPTNTNSMPKTKDKIAKKSKNSKNKEEENENLALYEEYQKQAKMLHMLLKDLQFWIKQTTEILKAGLSRVRQIVVNERVVDEKVQSQRKEVFFKNKAKQYLELFNLCVNLLEIKQLQKNISEGVVDLMKQIYEFII